MTSKRRYGLQTRDEAWHGVVASRRSEFITTPTQGSSGRRAFTRELISFAYSVFLTGSTLFVLALIFGLFLIAGNQGVGK